MKIKPLNLSKSTIIFTGTYRAVEEKHTANFYLDYILDYLSGTREIGFYTFKGKKYGKIEPPIVTKIGTLSELHRGQYNSSAARSVIIGFDGEIGSIKEVELRLWFPNNGVPESNAFVLTSNTTRFEVKRGSTYARYDELENIINTNRYKTIPIGISLKYI